MYATNRSMRMSDGLRSCGAMFFLMRVAFLLGVVDLRDKEVALETMYSAT